MAAVVTIFAQAFVGISVGFVATHRRGNGSHVWYCGVSLVGWPHFWRYLSHANYSFFLSSGLGSTSLHSFSCLHTFLYFLFDFLLISTSYNHFDSPHLNHFFPPTLYLIHFMMAAGRAPRNLELQEFDKQQK